MVPGIGCTDQEEARNERETSLQGRVRCWRAIYGWLLQPSTGFFAIWLQFAGPCDPNHCHRPDFPRGRMGRFWRWSRLL